MSDNQTLNNILHLFSPLHDVPVSVKVRDDYIMETPIGCFRIAYSTSTHTTALFYARHPDDLASMEDQTGSYGIAHKERLILISMYKVHHDVQSKWDVSDTRQQLDLTWVRREIAKIVHEMPRIQFREANLHHIADNIQSSVFVGYKIRPSQRVEGEYSVDVITKTDEKFRLPTIQQDNEHISNNIASPNPLVRWFRVLGRTLVGRQTVGSFSLKSNDPITRIPHTSFKEETLRDVIDADFAIRLEQIWNGVDPVHWRESKLLPVYRSGEAIRKKLHDIEDIRKGGTENAIRHMGTLATHLFIDGPASVLFSTLIDKMGDFGSKEKRNNVPEEWHRIVDTNSRRLITIESTLHKNLIHPDPHHFGDLQWVNPAEHICNYTASRDTLLAPDAERTFGNWVKSLFLAPYSSSFEYRGDNYKLLTSKELDQIKIVQTQVSNGIIMYYVHETGILYAHYNQPDYMTFNRKLPADAANFLTIGSVISFDLRRNGEGHMQSLSFDDFQNEIRRAVNAPTLILSSADTPTDDVINAPRLNAPTLPLPTVALKLESNDGVRQG